MRCTCLQHYRKQPETVRVIHSNNGYTQAAQNIVSPPSKGSMCDIPTLTIAMWLAIRTYMDISIESL